MGEMLDNCFMNKNSINYAPEKYDYELTLQMFMGSMREHLSFELLRNDLLLRVAVFHQK